MFQERKPAFAIFLTIIFLSVFVFLTTSHAAPKMSGTKDRSGVTIFKRAALLKLPRTIKVSRVVVVQETDYSLILDVHYTYQDEVPEKEIKLFVLPDMPYWASNNADIEKGSGVARVSIDLYEKKMKEDQVTEYETSKLIVSFDHYGPDKFQGAIYKEIIPFKKMWKARSRAENSVAK